MSTMLHLFYENRYGVGIAYVNWRKSRLELKRKQQVFWVAVDARRPIKWHGFERGKLLSDRLDDRQFKRCKLQGVSHVNPVGWKVNQRESCRHDTPGAYCVLSLHLRIGFVEYLVHDE